MAAAASAADFSAVVTNVSASAESSDSADSTESNEQESKYKGVYDLALGTPNVVTNVEGNDVYRYNFTLTKSGKLSITTRDLANAILYQSDDKKLDLMSGSESYNLNPGSYYIEAKTKYKSDDGDGELIVNFVASNEKFTDKGDGVTSTNTIKLASNTKTAVATKGFFAKSNDQSDSYKINLSGIIKYILRTFPN